MILKDDGLSFSGISSADVFSTWHHTGRLFSAGYNPWGQAKVCCLFVFSQYLLINKLQPQILVMFVRAKGNLRV